MKKVIFIILLLFPFFTNACNIRPYAKSYTNKIHSVLGGKRPTLVFEDGSSDARVGFYNSATGTIHLYKADYRGKCSNNLPYLKSVISHEYSHHAAKELKKVSRLKGEKLAYVAEHSIGDAIFGSDNVKYDNDKDLDHPKDYRTIKRFILTKQSRKFIPSGNKIYSKNK